MMILRRCLWMLAAVVAPPFFQFWFVRIFIKSSWWSAFVDAQPPNLGLVETFGPALTLGWFCLFRATGRGALQLMLALGYFAVMTGVLIWVAIGAAGGI